MLGTEVVSVVAMVVASVGVIAAGAVWWMLRGDLDRRSRLVMDRLNTAETALTALRLSDRDSSVVLTGLDAMITELVERVAFLEVPPARRVRATTPKPVPAKKPTKKAPAKKAAPRKKAS